MNPAGSDTTRLTAPAQPAAKPTPNGWPQPVLSGIERELARFVGPLAATLVRRAAQHHSSVDTLVSALLPSIESQQDRDAFKRTCARRAVMRHAPAPDAPAPAPSTAPTLAPAAPLLPAPARASSPRETTAQVAGSPLLRAAEALLGALPRLRDITTQANPAELRGQLLQRLTAFEAEAAAGGVSPTHIAAARCLLCNFVDEVITATPWGAQGRWTAQALTAVQPPGNDPLDVAQKMLADPLAHAPLLDLFYVCIALGFEGRLRHTPQARAQLDILAARLRTLMQTLHGRAGTPRTLSPRWRGLATRGHRDLGFVPPWAVVAFCAALLLATWLALNARLDARARPVFARLAAVPAALQSARDAVVARPRLAALLPADAQIEVRDEAQRSLITLPADTLFIPGSARLNPRADELLARVSQALRSQLALGGEVSVIGHGDNAPPTSLQFSTGWHLTRAQAQAVANTLSAHRVAPARAEGRAEFEPRAPNTTPAGRALNRRVEIELRLPRPEEMAP